MDGGGVGTLFAPDDGTAHPGIIVLGGSDAGEGARGTAMLLASHGYAALSLAYFGAKGLPGTLERIPMEYFANTVRWMHRRKQVDGRFVAFYGESRGTEPALWTAANVRGVNAVVARSPSFVLWEGVTRSHLPGDAAWTLGGKPLPFIPNRIGVGFAASYIWDAIVGTPVRQADLFNQNLRDYGATGAIAIPVEKIAGPVLLLAGKDDQIWPSAAMAQRLMDRLHRFHHGYADESIAYDDVGHPIPYAYLPAGGERGGLTFAVGGTTAGTARAQADAWPRILAFLDKASRAALAR
jgi:dienelactone hydrolase